MKVLLVIFGLVIMTGKASAGLMTEEIFQQRQAQCLNEAENRFRFLMEKITGVSCNVKPGKNRKMLEASLSVNHRVEDLSPFFVLAASIHDAYYGPGPNVEMELGYGIRTMDGSHTISVEGKKRWQWLIEKAWIFSDVVIPSVESSRVEMTEPATYDSLGGILSHEQKNTFVSGMKVLYPADYLPVVHLKNRGSEIVTEYEYDVQAYSNCLEAIAKELN